MIHLGLDRSERRAYIRALHHSYDVRYRVVLYDADENPVRNFTVPNSLVLGGAVQVDTDADVTRSLQLVVFDPKNAFALDPDSPGQAKIFADNLVRVVHECYVDDIGDWVECPIFHGPVTSLRRFGAELEISAQGKESLHLAPRLLWKTSTFRKGENTVDTIRTILARSGEERFDIDESAKKLPNDLSLSRHDEAWKEAKKLAVGMDRQLFFDGRGRVRLRKHSKNPVFTFYLRNIETALPPSVLTRPDVTFDFGFRNVVEVLGPDPSGSKTRVRYVARPNPGHPLSPESLAFNGKPRYLVERVENNKVKRTSDAKEIAERMLDDKLKIGVNATFDALTMPFLEELDSIALVLDDERVEFRLRQYTLQLGQGSMSVGYLRRPEIRRRKKRRG